jgi:assimilatory nitrate reductase catalytic subunit
MTKTTCPYCGVGCGVKIQTAPNTGAHADLFPIKIVGVQGDESHPANFGKLCTKGSSLHLTAEPARQAATRQLYPQMRNASTNQVQSVSWNEALDSVALRFAQCIAAHGPDSVAFYVSGQLLTEDYYVFNKLAKGLVGTNNIDSNSRLCMSSAVAGYKKSLGSDSPPLSYTDIEAAQTLFISGSNTAYAHPVLFRRIEAAREADPSKRLIVVDPRRTDTAAMADLHLAILPGTDVALYNTLLHIMIWERWIDPAFIDAHTEHFSLISNRVREMTPKMGAQICGVREQDLIQAAQWFAQSTGTVSLYCQGLNQSRNGTANNTALINLHLATAQIARVGAGPFSLTGQPNAMGGREVGALSNLLPAHRDLNSAEDRSQVAQFWGVKPLAQKPGASAVDLFKAIDTGVIKMVWIACTNPVQSMPDAGNVAKALAKAQLVVLQEAFRDTATAAFAHVILPAATWGEKEGTVTNSERRITRVRQAIKPPAQAKPDWWIATQFAQKLEHHLAILGCERRLDPNRSLFNYSDAESIWLEHRATTAGQDLDITGLTYAKLNERPMQWPFTGTPTPRLFENKEFKTATGKAQFIDTAHRSASDSLDAKFPFSLTTARLRDQWHGMSRTGTTGHLFGHCAEPTVDISQPDAKRLQIKSGDFIRVTSRRGNIVLPAHVSQSQRAGQVHIAMHWGPEFVGSNSVNNLTNSVYCADSKQPELKFSAVKLEPMSIKNRLLMLVWSQPGQAQTLRQELLQSFKQEIFCYASLFSTGNLADQANKNKKEGVLLRVASLEPIQPEIIESIEAKLGIETRILLRYEDKVLSTQRRMAIVDNQMIYLTVQGDARAETWLKPMLQECVDVERFRSSILMPIAPQFAAIPSDSVVCQCHGVKQSQIEQHLISKSESKASPLDQLKQQLRCGTECGSCLPQLQRMILAAKEASVHD